MEIFIIRKSFFIIPCIIFCVIERKVVYGNSILGNILRNHSSHYLSFTAEETNTLLYNLGHQNEDIFLNISQLIKKSQFPVEVYTVVTPDGYKLKLFRIPGSGPVVFLMHGLICSADDWITGGVNSGMGFLLAAQGYDVWMGNNRGNKHSRHNIYISPSERKFWDFSFHEMGLYDLPTMIDFILKKTNITSLIYIGHSQGTTGFFVMCSLRPEYNEKISLMISLSAIAWMSHVVSPLVRFLSSMIQELSALTSFLGIYEIFQDTASLRLFQRHFCGSVLKAFIICEQINSNIGGFNYNQTNFPRLPVIYNHFPASSSAKQVLHYGQLVQSGYFRQYDYGSLNLEKYGSPTPPSYPVEKITAPVAIFYGEGDWLSAVTDVNILKSKLPNVVDFYGVEDKHFNHFDFIYAKDSKKLLLPRILRLIKKYSK